MSSWMNPIPATLAELINNTDKGRLERANDVKILSHSVDYRSANIMKINGQDKVVFMIIVTFITQSSSGGKYTVIVNIPILSKARTAKYKSILNYPIKVYSSSPDFKYRYAYVLNKSNNLFVTRDIERELGIAMTEPPMKRNPKMIAMVDKHIYKCLISLDGLRINLRPKSL